MSNVKYTPGPWEVVGGNVYTKLGAENGAGVKAHYTDGWCIASISPFPCINSSGENESLSIAESTANGYLIKAAPHLLKALKAITSLYETDEGCRALPEYVNAIAAIAEAEGR